MESVSEVVESLLEATKPTAELSRTGLDVKGAPQEPSRKPSLIITPSSFLSPLPLDELLESARSKLKKAVNTSRETLQGGGRAERPLRTNPPWVFSPSGAAFPQIHSLGGLPHHLQAQITIYKGTTGKYHVKALQRRKAPPACPRIISCSAFCSPLCSTRKVPGIHPQPHPTTNPPGCPSLLRGDAAAQSQEGVLEAALIAPHLHESLRAAGNPRFVSISHLTFPTRNPSSR